MDPILLSFISAIVVAVISGGVNLIISKHNNDKLTALMEYRLNELEKKQDKHNNLMERTFKLEVKMDAVEKDLRDLKN